MTLRRIELAPKPVDEVVKMAEELLADARSGKCRSFILAAVYETPGEPACSCTIAAGNADVPPMVVALEHAKLRLLGYAEVCNFVQAPE